LWLHSLKVAQLLRSAACLHTNQFRSYLNHLVIAVAYLGGALLAFVGCGKNVELCASGRKRTLVDIDSAQVDIDTTCSPGRSETKTLVTQPTIIRIKI